MKYPIQFAAAVGLGGVSIAAVGYVAAKIWGLDGSSASLASDNALASPQSVAEPQSLLLLSAALFALALWYQRSNVIRPFS